MNRVTKDDERMKYGEGVSFPQLAVVLGGSVMSSLSGVYGKPQPPTIFCALYMSLIAVWSTGYLNTELCVTIWYGIQYPCPSHVIITIVSEVENLFFWGEPQDQTTISQKIQTPG